MKDKVVISDKRFVNSPIVDYYYRIDLQYKSKQLNNQDNINNIDISELFNIEREESKKYRLTGKIDYLSILNNLVNDYNNIEDFFIRYSTSNDVKNFLNSFKVYLLVNSDVYTSLGNNNYKHRYEVLSEINDIILYPCGFSRNIFFEQNYLYNFNIDIDLTDRFDFFNKPITELVLFFDYQLDTNKNEIRYKKDFDSNSTSGNSLTIQEGTNNTYIENDLIIGDLINRPDNVFDETIINQQEYKISVKYNNNNNNFLFKYNPFHKIKIKDYNDTTYFGNVSGNTKNFINIPTYARDIGNGNVIWKELLPNGFIDPTTNLGVNFPFVNGRHYVYTNHVLSMQPDLANLNTNQVFKDINLQGYDNDLFIIDNNNLNPTC